MTVDESPLEFLSRLSAELDAGIVDLPPFPQVVLKVQEALRNPNYTPQTISRVITTERSLADRLLQMANSTAFNATGRVIISLEVAITRLGAQKVYSVALAHAIHHIRQNEAQRPIARRLDDLWAQCVTVAHFCEVVAKKSSLPTPGAFGAGLLHGIGRFYILMKSVRPSSGPPIQINDALIETWHPAIAKAVLETWQMEPAVCEAVGAQTEVHVARSGAPSLTDVLMASIRLADRLQNRYDTSNFNVGGPFARLGLTLEICQTLIAEASGEVVALQRALRA